MGPLAIRARLYNHQFLLQILQGKILQNTFHISRLKSAFVRGNDGKISQTIQELIKNSNLENTVLAATDQHRTNLTL